ncbi:MAG: DUF6677 family protein [Smithella sp.]
MNLATKAALYNALLFPGWGHIYLKKYRRGIVYIVTILAGIFSLCWSIAQVALTILRAKPFKKGAVDINTVFNLSTETIKAITERGGATSNYILLILSFIIFLWLFSIIDAYRIGKKQMQINSTSAEN